MTARTDRELRAAGWKIGTVDEFLGIPPEIAMILDVKLALAVCLRQHRKAKRMSQTTLAKRIGSSQSRMVKIEQADSSVSFELLFKALLAAGVTHAKIGAVFATANPHAVPLSVTTVSVPTETPTRT